MNPLRRLAIHMLKRRQINRHRGMDVEKPLRLEAEYIVQNNDPNYLEIFASSVLGRDVEITQETRDAIYELKGHLKSVEPAFMGKPFQLGALDLEIDTLIAVLSQFNKPSVLEIGGANGYSSAFLYELLSRTNGRIVQIDMPRFERKSLHPYGILLRYAVATGEVKNTGTLRDFVPGGVIPRTKRGGVASSTKLSTHSPEYITRRRRTISSSRAPSRKSKVRFLSD